MSSPVRVLLVDDDPLVRQGLRFLLASATDIEVVGEAGDGHEAITLTTTCSPDVVLMDLRMPRVDGIAATRSIRELSSPPHVIALTTWDVDDAVLAALDAGASGFLLKTDSPDGIIRAIRSAMVGDAVLSPRSTRQLLDKVMRDGPSESRRAAASAVEGLTEREREVAALVGQGLTNAEIGGRMYLSEATVKTHLGAISMKLGLRNRVAVAVLAERAGLLSD